MCVERSPRGYHRGYISKMLEDLGVSISRTNIIQGRNFISLESSIGSAYPLLVCVVNLTHLPVNLISLGGS